ncbi:hypothetical protein L7F22_016007 [Adiantum nelumboides]|nr:hypothetical protein [Adiantum nelumboides]
MFTQVMQNPRFMALLQLPPPSQSIGTKKQKSEPAKAQPQVIHTAESMETPVHLLETMQSPNPVHNAQEQVAETPVFQAVPVQPATFQQPIVGSNGQGSDLQAMQQFYTPGTVFGGAQTMMPNPMYGGIGLQPGFQSTHGQFGMPHASFGMAGIVNQQPYMTSPGQLNSDQGTQINPNNLPMFQSLPYDNLTPLEKPTPYKEGGKGVTFTTFTGFDDRKKALSFLQQFDKAYAGGNFTEASKESSVQCGLAYIIAVVAQFDEYTNDLIYLREGSCLPRPQYRKKTASSTESYSFGPSRRQWSTEEGTSPVPTPKSTGSLGSRSGSEVSSTAHSFTYSRSLRQTLQEVKMVQIWDNMFRTCEMYGKALLQEGAIKVGDLEEWGRSSNSAKGKIICVGLPAYSLLKSLIRSGKAGVSGLLLLDGYEVTMDNRPQERVFDWFFEPLLVLKEQIRVANLKENEELYLLKYVLTCGDLSRWNEWQAASLLPEDEVRKGELLAWSRRVQGIATSVSRLPTFRRRYQGVVKLLIAYAHGNFSSPAGKNKGSPDTSFSSEGSVRFVKPQGA